MIAAKGNKIYEKLPLVYEYLMRKVQYEIWAKYIYTLVENYVKKNSNVLELAAGNCNFAKHFKRYYPNLIATDISINMLTSVWNASVPKVCCEMTKLPFKEKFSLIYSSFDSVNYLTSRKKLLDLFKQIYELLEDKGIFTFDVSLEKNSLIHSQVADRQGNYKGITFKQRSEYNKATRIHKNIFLIKLENNKVYKEIHKQKIYPFETYFELIELAGLSVMECFKAFTYKKGRPDSERVQFILRKVKN